MAKGSVRKKGKKWYYRYYVEDASGNLVQKECVGTESKSETEKLLRKAMEEYEKMKNGTFDVFYGPVYDNEGNLRIAEGESMTDNAMLSDFDWYVEGVSVDE